MFISRIEAKVFYRHSPEEVRALDAAIQPLADHLRAACYQGHRVKISRILGGNYFRASDAAMMHKELLRAAKHARAHLDDYFPMMRQGIIANAEALESATDSYWKSFRRHQTEIIPTI